ncbi:phage terminase large subunit GpA-like protein [Hydrogenoanaerobacterium saccharovorans]|uniref:Phage terminase, large subunit GpA n=1 Tax=Hydrogenoanaerobacterium saccharovorans TaxID=474960 RepID=A0A1H8A0E5_9FIRM|nr:phage terminase large subunit family protein [Hydrogenoanaerobacterium saccharovorans]RPF48249.1 phage terminase large subunit GpA-like protein [Hydrogenoanaerobacterium saccharovorans]SEM64061.1 Phage terminase, large subunit GpA [Hydrogenoanaerobacterium saccharovorans]
MKQATIDLFTQIFSVLAPPPNLTISEWADKYRYLSQESSAQPGKWNTAKTPYLREIMDAITDDETKKVVFMSAAQLGKTDGPILNSIGYYMYCDPCPIMVLQPTIQMAETFSKDRLAPMLRDTPILRDKINDKSRNSGNTILQKIFPGGHVTMVGANSASSLASRPIRILLADEIDRYSETAGKEGDPLLLASKRITTFWNKKEVYTSTPTIKGLSRIEVEYIHSTQEEWNVPCPECGEYQPMEWAQVIFDKENLEEICYACSKCGVVLSEPTWKEQYINGKFVAKFPNRKVRGFHLNALSSLLTEWKDIVQKFLTANEEKKKGNIHLLKVWTNTEMGQTWEEEGEQLEQDDLYKRREKYNCEVPEEVICLTAGIDTQDDRFEIEVVGWGVDKESWGIKYQVIYGDLKLPEIWNELDTFLSQTFTRADGAKLKIICACMDSGGHFTNQVYKFCKARTARRVYAIKGKGGMEVPYVKKPTKSNRAKTPLFIIGVDTGKSLLYQCLAITEEGPNYCHFPKEKDRGYTQEYFKGLTAEKMVLTYKQGRAQHIWMLKDSGYKRNEPLDIRNYATAALEIANPVLKKPDKTDVTGSPIKKRGRRSRSGGVI